MVLPQVGTEAANWLKDVELIARFMGRMHRLFNRDFVIGVYDVRTGVGEDLYFVDTDLPNLGKLSALISIRDATNKFSQDNW